MDNLGLNYKQDEEEPPSYESAATAVVSMASSNNNISKLEVPNSNPGDEDESIIPGRCGIFCWKPEWMQRFPTKRWFIAVFLLATTIKGMAGSYLPSTISSVEKRLKISTETIGYVMSGNEFSQILFALILSYVGGKGHRPRWMALGVFVSAVAYLMFAAPHFLYGPGNEALSYTKEYYSQFRNRTDVPMINSSYLSSKNLSADLDADGICKLRNDIISEELDCGIGDDSIAPMAIIFISQFMAGIGSVLLYTLAGPFIDDHMKPLQAPIMIAATGAVRQCGPLIGYFIAYFCLKLYVSPWLTPLITNKDERWLGAWWLGCVLFSILMGAISVLMVLFPKILKTSQRQKALHVDIELNHTASQVHVQEKPVVRNEPIFQKSTNELKFWASLVDLMKNKANLWNNLSILFFGFALSGFGTYFPKYLEIAIKQNAANAALTTGLSSILFQVAGLILSGYVISRFRLRARTLASVNIVVDVMIVLVLMSFSQLVCKQGQVVLDTSIHEPRQTSNYANGLSSNWNIGTNSSLQLPLSSCNSECHCTNSQNTPVCYLEQNLMFPSACHAGCKSYDAASQVYTNCSCLPSPNIKLTLGKCVDSDSCFSTFLLFLSLIALVRFGSSFGRIGNVLIPYRCVDRSQKSLASGLSFVMWSIVSIPSPIMYGKIIDSTCIRWGTKCGGKGNCLLYDDVKFAYAMSLTAAGLCFFGMICDVMLWYHVKDLKLYGEEDESVKSEPNTK